MPPTVPTSSTYKPWYNETIHRERVQRRRLERKWLKTGLEVDKQIYQQQCVHVVDVINGAKAQNYREVLTSSNAGQS